MECGHNLSLPSEPSPKDVSLDEKLAKIQRYLPKGLTEKILSQRDKIEGERKQVTVMFCDMEGFTPLSEKLGPEEAYSIIDQVYEILIHGLWPFLEPPLLWRTPLSGRFDQAWLSTGRWPGLAIE
jgi:hypothetical protein